MQEIEMLSSRARDFFVHYLRATSSSEQHIFTNMPDASTIGGHSCLLSPSQRFTRSEGGTTIRTRTPSPGRNTSMHGNENELLSNTQYFDAIQSRSIGHDTNDYKSSRESSGNEATSTNIIRDNGIALRRIRHSEVVLADQVSVEY